MTFLNPWVLGLAGVCALIPLIIYLIFLRRYTPLRWGAMEILRRALKKHSRRTKLQDLILLAVRTLLLVCLGLAFARPIGSSLASRFAEKELNVVVIDNTLSMAYRDAGLSLFDEGRDAAGGLLRQLPENSRFLVLPLVSKPAESATITEERVIAEGLIDSMEQVDHGSGVLDSLQRLDADLSATGGVSTHVYVITDGQTSTWRGEEGILSQLGQLEQNSSLRILELAPEEVNNRSVRVVGIDGLPATVDRPVVFRVEVAGDAGDAGEEVPLILTIDDAVVDRRFPRLRENGRAEAEFRRVFREAGTHSIKVAIEEDPLEQDNSAWFTCDIKDSVPVLLIDSKSKAATYLAAALNPDVLGPEGSPYHVTRVRPADSTREDLSRYALVVVSDLGVLDKEETDRLFDWVGAGGSMICFVRENALLPPDMGLSISDARLVAEGQEPVRYEFGTDSDILSLLRRNPSLKRDIDAVRSSYARTFALGSQSRINVLLSTGKGEPVLVESPWQSGRVILGGMSLETEESDLPLKPSFVALLHEMAGNLTSGDASRSILAGQSWVTPISRDLIGAGVTLYGPDTSLGVKDEWLKDSGTGRMLILETPRLDRRGIWSLTSSSRREILRSVAVNPPAEESELSYMGEADWGFAEDSVRRVWSANDYLTAGIRQEKRGSEVSGALLFLALILAVADTLLAWWFGGAPVLPKAPEGRRA